MKALRIGWLSVLAALGVVTAGNAAFLETFDGLNAVDLAGQFSGANAWAQASSMAGYSGYVSLDAEKDGTYGVIGNSGGDRANAIAIESGTIAGEGTLVVEMDLRPAFPPSTFTVGLGVGTGGLVDGSDNYLYSVMNSGGVNDLFRSKTGGLYNADAGHTKTYARADDVWQHHRIEVALDINGIVTGAKAYIDNHLAGTWTFLATPAWTPTHVGFLIGSSAGAGLLDGMADNFAYRFVPTRIGSFLETFDFLIPGDLAGQSSGVKAWAQAAGMAGGSGYVDAGAKKDGAYGVLGNWTSDRANAIAVEAGTITGEGTLTVEMDMRPAFTPSTFTVGLGVGTGGLVDGSDNYLYSVMNSGGVNDLFRSKTGGLDNADAGHAKTYTRADDVWQHHRIEVDLDTDGIVTDASAYIDDNLAGIWAFLATPAWTPTHVGFLIGNSSGAKTLDGMADNFAYSFVPAPTRGTVITIR